MNPVSINSTNITQFGFKATVDLDNRKLIFDISDFTTFVGGGAANVLGVAFEVIDPAGVTTHAINFTSPDIDTNNILPFEVNLASGMALFGTYRVKGQIKEANGTIYTVEIPPKEGCEPKGWDGKGVEGSFKELVDCSAPYIRLNETTNLTYLGKRASIVTKSGNLYYPQGTLAAKAFTRTPFQTSEVYTGDFMVRNKTLGTFDLGDQFFVRIPYNTKYPFEVNCMSRLCNIACCLEGLYNDYKNNCTTAKGRAAKDKMDEVSPLLFIAVSKEKCGKDASSEIAQIKKILSCDCDDCNSKTVEPVPVQQGDGTSIIVEGDCATSVTPATVGDVTTYTAKTKYTKVVKGDEDDLAWTITKTEDDCNINYAISFNYEKLAETILITIKNDSDLLTLFNSLVATIGSGLSIAGLNGKCVIDLSSCNYILQEDFKVTPATVTSIVIDGVTYAAPGGLNMSNAAGIQTWLNGLAKGAWVAGYVAHVVPPGGVLTITSANNTHNIGVISFAFNTVDVNRSFIGNCKTLTQVLQAIIDYLCTISTLQVRLGVEMKLCHMDPKGSVDELVFGVSALLSDYLIAMSKELCTLGTLISNAGSIGCKQMKDTFPVSDAAIEDDDFVLMTRNGECARGTMKELAIKLFKLAQVDVDVKSEFCAVDCGGDGACYSITDFESSTTAV